MSGGSGSGTPVVPGSIATTVATAGGAAFVLERVTQPDIEPITLAQMKTHLREFSSVTARDADITGLITAAREWVEDYTGRALVDQTWRLTVGSDARPFAYTDANRVTGIYYGPWYSSTGEFRLRKSPVLSITSFVSADSAGVETTIDPTTYALCEPDSKWPRIAMLNGAASGAFKIEFRAGFADRLGSPQQGAEVVPVRFIQAMKLWAEANYNRDEKTMELLLNVAEKLITPERSELGLA